MIEWKIFVTYISWERLSSKILQLFLIFAIMPYNIQSSFICSLMQKYFSNRFEMFILSYVMTEVITVVSIFLWFLCVTYITCHHITKLTTINNIVANTIRHPFVFDRPSLYSNFHCNKHPNAAIIKTFLNICFNFSLSTKLIKSNNVQ